MPIKCGAWMAAAMMLAVPAMAEAETKPRAIITVDKLAKEKPVQAFVQPYTLASSARVIYDTCATEIGITEPHASYFAARHQKLTKAYLQAFDDAFVSRMKAPSPQSMRKDYAAYLAKIAKPAIERTQKAIASAGCTDKTVVAMVDYYKKIEEAEQAGHTIPLTNYVDKAKKRAEERAKKKEANK